jgi:FAD/FMN-containing dehydrogenase
VAGDDPDPVVVTDPEVLFTSLVEVVGAEHVLVDPGLRASYETDWTGRFAGASLCVVRPASTADVASVLRVCWKAGVPVVVQGGNTGLVGGGVPAPEGKPCVLMSLVRLDSLGAVDVAARQVTVGAGVRLGVLQQHARASGLDFGVDLAARDSCTAGGLAATNAGGIRVLRHGSMREQVAGVEAVLADGTVVSHLGGLAKDNTGYDLGMLLCGSEGTLAVITRLRLRLVGVPVARAVALVGVASTADAVALIASVRDSLPDLAAAELFYPPGLELVRAATGLPSPFTAEAGAYLVLECAGASDPTSQLVSALESASGLVDAAVAEDLAGQRRLWTYREAHTEAINAAGVPVKLDVSVPLGSLDAFVAEVPEVIAAVAPLARPILFGHVNEGNLHVNVLDCVDLGEEVTDAVLQLVARYSGSISSEHGIGRAKVPWFGLSRSREEIATMRAVKGALDPDGQLNPGVLFPA